MTTNCFEIPVLKREIKRQFDLAELNLQVQDPVRGEISFIESILVSGFPKGEVFQNCLESFLSGEYSNDGDKVKAYYDIVTKAYGERLASYAVFASERKFTGKFDIDPASIELQMLDGSVYPIVKNNYERFLIGNMAPNKRGVQAMYQNEDDLLYDIYLATEFVDFLNKYDYLFYTNPEMFKIDRNENPYHRIFSIFEHTDASGKVEFEKSLLDKKVFLGSFKSKPESYVKVVAEINEPYQFVHRSFNATTKSRKDYAFLCMKIATFMEFFDRFVKQKIIDEMTELYTSGNGDPRFENTDRAIDFLFSKFGELLIFLYNPYMDLSSEIEMLDKIYKLYDKKLIESSRPEFVHRLNDLNSVLQGKTIEIHPLNDNPPMDLIFKKKKTVIKVYADRTEPREFSYMALENTDVPFFVNEVGESFNSVKEFMTFATLETVFNFPKDQAYALRNNFKLIPRFFQEMVACSIKDAITTNVDGLMKQGEIYDLLSKKPKTTGYIYTLFTPSDPFFKFFSAYLNAYITNTAPSTEVVNITNEKIIQWIEKRKKHLQQIFFAVREHSKVKEKLKKKDALFNLFSLIFGLDRVDSFITIANEKEQDKLMQDCELYVKEELSFVLARTGLNEEELAELLEDNGQSVIEKYSVFSINDAYLVLETLSRKIYPYILGEEGEVNYNLCLSIILGKKVKDVTRKNFAEKIDESIKILNALKLLYHLHVSSDA